MNLAARASSFSTAHRYLDDVPNGTPVDVEAISVTVTDTAGASDATSTSVSVRDAAPTIFSVNGPVDPIQLGGSANIGVTFADHGHDLLGRW